MMYHMFKTPPWIVSVCLRRHWHTTGGIHHHPKAHDLDAAGGKTEVVVCLDLIRISLIKQREASIDPTVICPKGLTGLFPTVHDSSHGMHETIHK